MVVKDVLGATTSDVVHPAAGAALDEAAAATSMSVSAFVLTHATEAAREVLADRTSFILLTRLGVDVGEQGRGLGSALVRDALLQTAAIADRVGVRALLIHAETPEAAEFYRRIDQGFEPSPTDPLHLILLMKDLRTAIRQATGATDAGASRI